MKIDALLKIRGIKHGRCTVCDKLTLFLLNDSVGTIRSHAVCLYCHSVSRHRHIAHCIVNALQNKGVERFGDIKQRSGSAIFFAEFGAPLVRVLRMNSSIGSSE
jgi:hypothetical protein